MNTKNTDPSKSNPSFITPVLLTLQGGTKSPKARNTNTISNSKFGDFIQNQIAPKLKPQRKTDKRHFSPLLSMPNDREEEKEEEIDIKNPENFLKVLEKMNFKDPYDEAEDLKLFSNPHKQVALAPWTSYYPSEAQMKGFFQNYKDFFPNGIENLHMNQPPEIRNYFEERPCTYRLRKVPKPAITSFQPHEPHMKITVLRTSFDKNGIIEYHITPQGMVNSNRNTDHDDIVIGRQDATPEGIIPNDICLYFSDRIISRVHCKIITKYGFKTPRKIPQNFLAFLMMSHKRLGAKSKGYKLPETLYRHIYSFIKEPRKFWLVDLGSSFGTYIRLKGDMMYPLERGQTYLVGLDTIFNIVDLRNVILPKDQKALEDEQREKGCAWDTEEFLKFLFHEKIYNKTEIHGLSKLESDMLDIMIANQKELFHGEDTTYLETDRNQPYFQRPYIKIELQNYGGINATPNHILVGDSKREFILGRTQECDINLNQKTAISRKQSRLICHEGVWFIADGIPGKKSSNGTWLSLTDYRLKRERLESEPREIDHGTEIKISDTVFQVNWTFFILYNKRSKYLIMNKWIMLGRKGKLFRAFFMGV